MDSIALLQPIVIKPSSQPALPAPGSASQAPTVPMKQASDTASFNAAQAEQKRVQTLQRMAQDIANVFIVSDQTFSLFKDATGQYITRFTSLRDGRVTYIPEPTLFKMSSGGAPAPLVTLKV